MNIISIDQSKSSTGIFCKTGGMEFSYTIINKPKAPTGAALNNIYQELLKILDFHKPDFVIMEAPAFQGSRAVQMGEVAGVVKLAIEHSAIDDVIQISPGTWKHFTIGTLSKKAKDVYLKAANDLYNRDFTNIDEADAFMMWDAIRIISNTPIDKMSPAAGKIFNQLAEIVAKGGKQ